MYVLKYLNYCIYMFTASVIEILLLIPSFKLYRFKFKLIILYTFKIMKTLLRETNLNP